MMRKEAHLARRGLIMFFLLTFIWSWLLWLPKVLGTAGKLTLSGPLNFILGTLAVFGPSVAAFSLTFAREGITGVRRLWKRGWDWRFRKVRLIPTLLPMPAIGAVTAILLSVFGRGVAWEYGLPPIMIAPIFLLILVTNALPEEYGWRGFALDRLQQRWSALTSSLILGALWGVWHLPLFMISGSAIRGGHTDLAVYHSDYGFGSVVHLAA
jgi:membrane protease YdiL (CAAX protease family)